MIELFSSNYKAGVLHVARACGVFTAAEVELLDADCDFYADEASGAADQDEFIQIDVENREVQGFIHYGLASITDRTWYLYWIAVAPEARSLGVGRALVEAMETHLASLNGRLALIETSSQAAFSRPREFYLQLGYHLTAEIPDFYSDGDHKCIYAKHF